MSGLPPTSPAPIYVDITTWPTPGSLKYWNAQAIASISPNMTNWTIGHASEDLSPRDADNKALWSAVLQLFPGSHCDDYEIVWP